MRRVVLLLATIPAAALQIALLGVPATAAPSAPTPRAGHWTRISVRPSSFTDSPAVVRDARGALHLLYLERVGIGRSTLSSRVLTPSGTWAAPVVVAPSWASMTSPDAELVDGAVMAFWGGRSTTAPIDPGAGSAWAARRAAAGWQLLPMPSSRSSAPADAGHLATTVDAAGTPWFSWTTSSITGLHAGFDPAGSETESPIGCCELGSNLARDPVTGELFAAARFVRADGEGVHLRPVTPNAGDGIVLSSSATNGASMVRSTRMPLATRPAGGVYVAYCAVMPRCTAIRVANQRDRGLTIRIKEPARADSVGVSPGRDGRLWVHWADRTGAVWAARSNRAATRWGSPRRIPGPPGVNKTWNVVGDGARGPLDLVLNATTPAGTHLWSARFAPALTLAPVPPVVLDGSMQVVRVHVSDAGDPVRAVVTFRGARRVSTAQGQAVLVIPPDTPRGRYRLTATSVGYTADAGTLVIR